MATDPTYACVQTRDRLHARWTALLRALGVAEAAAVAVFTDVVHRYSAAGRCYHNLTHILDVLETIELLGDLANDPVAVQLAAWFHDLIYDTRAKDNEERSAAFAERLLGEWRLSPGTVAAVVRIILATKTHQPGEDRDCQVLVDADLAILGAPEQEYAVYARAIRQEYAWVPEEAYRTGRGQVLEAFLQRERIYWTEPLHAALENSARRNLRHEVACLAAGGAIG